MKPLETTIRFTGDGLGHNAVILNQIKREGDVAIYSRTRERIGKLEGYEVIVIRHREGKTYQIAGKTITATEHEACPSANEFGPYGKFCIDLKRAEEIFNQWVKAQNDHNRESQERG